MYGGTGSSTTSGQWRMAAWATYTPVWTNSGSAPTIGDGTLAGRYRREGTSLHLQVRLVIGSTTTVGTGTVRLGIPTGVTPGPMQQVGVSFWFDSSTGVLTRGVAILDPSVSYVYAWLADGATPSSAAGLANGDIIAIGGTFELTP